MDKLEPCPFCDAPVKQPPQNSSRMLPNGEWWQFIWCENCDAQGGARKTADEAIVAWNTRAALNITAQQKGGDRA